MEQEDQWEATAMVQTRRRSLNHSCRNGSEKTWVDSEYILKVKVTGFADRLCIRYKRKSRVKEGSIKIISEF